MRRRAITLTITTTAFTLATSTLLISRTRRPGRHEFITGQLPVTVFIQCLKGSGGIGDLTRINDTVAIGIQHLDNRRWRTMHTSLASRPTRPLLTAVIRCHRIEHPSRHHCRHYYRYLFHTVLLSTFTKF